MLPEPESTYSHYEDFKDISDFPKPLNLGRWDIVLNTHENWDYGAQLSTFLGRVTQDPQYGERGKTLLEGGGA